jgi:GNAT superfamily N-acetyltransferase
VADGVTYRQMRPEDEDRVFDLWLSTWADSDEALERRALHSDPGYLARTYIAVGPDEQVLSTAHYWVREICDASGTPRRVGCVSHVSTHQTARRQGHARTLVGTTLRDAMAADGCEYALLFSSEMGVALYEGLGYRMMSSPVKRGLVQRDRPRYDGPYTVREGREPDWDIVARVYAEYNAGRPLAFVRDDPYWREFMAPKWTHVVQNWGGRAFTAYEATEGEPVGYALAYYPPPEFARNHYNLDQVFTLCEVCALPGHDGAIPALVEAVAGATLPGEVGGRVSVPREPVPSAALEAIFGATLNEYDDRRMMVLPLTGGVTYDDLEAMFASSASVFWLLDEF